MVEQHDREGPTERAWWAEALDPAENLRALTDVRGFGRRAAEDLADRLLGGGNGHSEARRTVSAEADVTEVIRRFRADAVRAGEVSASLIDNAAALFGLLVERLPAGTEPEADATILVTVTPGATAGAVFWVHNTSAVPVAAVRPHCAPPRSHTGLELPAGAVLFDPPLLDPLPARSSCGIEVTLAPPAGTEPGTYVSVVLATNVPGLYLPLRITVDAAEVAG